MPALGSRFSAAIQPWHARCECSNCNPNRRLRAAGSRSPLPDVIAAPAAGDCDHRCAGQMVKSAVRSLAARIHGYGLSHLVATTSCRIYGHSGAHRFAAPRNDISLDQALETGARQWLPRGGQTTCSNAGSPVPSGTDIVGTPWPTHIEGSSVPTAVYTPMPVPSLNGT